MTRGFSFLRWESRRAGTYGSLLSDRHGLLRGRLVLLLGLVPRGCKRARPVELRPQQPSLPPHLAATAMATVPVSHAARAPRPSPCSSGSEVLLTRRLTAHLPLPRHPEPEPRQPVGRRSEGPQPKHVKDQNKATFPTSSLCALTLSLATLF